MSDEEGARILVVDDDPGMRRAIWRVLMPPHDVTVAETRAEGLEQLGSADFDIALIDIRLPDGDGYLLNRQVRELAPETDVILMTGSTSHPDEKLYRALDDDAFYFFFKPVDRLVLLALVERCLRLRRAQRENRLHVERLSRDLDQARLFQRSLVLQQPLIHQGWHVQGRFRTCSAVGGDSFSALPVAETASFSLSDVVGHGVRAAMLAGMLRSSLRAASHADPEPETVLGNLLGGIDFLKPPDFATLVYGLLLPDGEVRYFNAGHPDLLWQVGDQVRQLCSTNPLVVSVNFDLPRGRSEAIRMAAGDRLLVYSDGVTEARNAGDDEFGVQRLQAALLECRGREMAASLDHILAVLDEHCQGRPAEDDVSVLMIERGSDPGTHAA